MARNALSGLIDPHVVVEPLGVAALLTGLLRVFGGFVAEERVGRRWTLGGIVLGALEVVLGAVLFSTKDLAPDLLAVITAAWGIASGTLLLAQGIHLRRVASGS